MSKRFLIVIAVVVSTIFIPYYVGYGCLYLIDYILQVNFTSSLQKNIAMWAFGALCLGMIYVIGAIFLRLIQQTINYIKNGSFN